MKKEKIIHGVRVHYRYSVSHVFLLLLTLCIIAVPVLMSFGPFIRTPNGNSNATIVDMFLIFFKKDNTPTVLQGLILQVQTLIKAPEGKPELAFISDIPNYVMCALPVLTLIPGVAAIFYFCFGLSGKWKKPIGVVSWAWLQFVFTVAAVIMPILFAFKFNDNPERLEAYLNIDQKILFIYAGASLLVAIFSSIFFSIGYKGKMYYKDAEKLPEIPPYVVTPHVVPKGKGPIPQPIIIETHVSKKVAPKEEVKVEFPKANISSNSKGLPEGLTKIENHQFSQNPNIEEAIIPDGIFDIAPSAFANCPNLTTLSIPRSVRKIGYNAFFNCKKLTKIKFEGLKEEWRYIVRGSNWLTSCGTTTVVCKDGAITVNPAH